MTPSEASSEPECELCELQKKLERALASIDVQKLLNLQIELACAIRSTLESMQTVQQAVVELRTMRSSGCLPES